MKKGHASSKRPAHLLIQIVFWLSLALLVSSAAVFARSRQSLQVPTRDEAAKFADSFLASLQEVGSMRNVNPELLHSLFVEGLPCPVVPFVETSVCRTLSSEDRRDYALAVLNMIWLMYEYQLSQPVPVWLQPDRLLANPFELFPIEVRPIAQKLVGIAKTMEAFKQLYADTKEAEARMLRIRSQMTESGRSNVPKNAATINEALRQNGFDSEDVDPISEIADGAFRYTRPPFVFIVARDRGILKLISFSFVTD